MSKIQKLIDSGRLGLKLLFDREPLTDRDRNAAQVSMLALQEAQDELNAMNSNQVNFPGIAAAVAALGPPAPPSKEAQKALAEVRRKQFKPLVTDDARRRKVSALVDKLITEADKLISPMTDVDGYNSAKAEVDSALEEWAEDSE